MTSIPTPPLMTVPPPPQQAPANVEYLSDIPQVSKDPPCCEKYFKDYKHNNHHLTFSVFVPGHYLLLTVCLKLCSWKTVHLSVQIMSVKRNIQAYCHTKCRLYK